MTSANLRCMWAGPPMPWTDDDRVRAWVAEHTPALLRLD